MEAVLDREAIVTGFEPEPMMEKHSYLLGTISLYAPAVDVSEYGNHPWLLLTERGWGGENEVGLRYEIAAEHIKHCWNHVALVTERHLFKG